MATAAVAPSPVPDAPPAPPGARARLLSGVFRVADPKITLASMSSLLLATAMAAHDGPIAWGWLALTVLGVFFVEAAKNASGEIVDWDTGVDQAVKDEDRSPFSGGKRVLLDGLMTRTETAVMAFVFYALCGACGYAIAIWREDRVVWLGVAGALLAFFYHAPPLRLAYRGLGELAVATTYGPIVAAGAYLVQRRAIAPHLVLASIPLGLVIGAFLVANELPDRAADEAGGKRTLVVRLGRDAAGPFFVAILVLAYALLAALPLLGVPAGILGGFLGLPHAASAARRLWRVPAHTRDVIPAQAATLLSFVLLSVGAAAGLLIARWL